jgi:mono/diheme cytochrome c family protein
MKKLLKGLLFTVLFLIVGGVIFVYATWNKTFEAPLPDFKASTDPAVIARGKYLAYGPAHCASCHTPMDKLDDVKKGVELPLSGGWEITIPPGTFRAPNITPDMETGIGKFTDPQLARALRYSVKHDGSVLVPFMPFQEMSDEDVIAVISFLRSQPAVHHDVKPRELTFLGKAIVAFGLIKPQGPNNTPPKMATKDTTATYGKYIANSVSNCVGCHTDRDLKTGKFTGVPFAGGFKMPPDAFSEGYGFVTPNITPDKETGIMANWNEATFISRFKAGRAHKGSPMPWESFSKLDSLELKALYSYLHTMQPVSKKIEKVVYSPGEKMPD